jgi:hypothetical protein
MKSHEPSSKIVVIAKFPKKAYRFWGALLLSMVLWKEDGRRNGKGKEKGKKKVKEKGKEKERVYMWSGASFWTNGYREGIAIISPLARTQLCAKQLQMWTLYTIISITFGGPYRYTVFGTLSRHKRTLLYKSSTPEFWPYLTCTTYKYAYDLTCAYVYMYDSCVCIYLYIRGDSWG